MKRTHYRLLDDTWFHLFPFVLESNEALGLTALKLTELVTKFDREHNMRNSPVERAMSLMDRLKQALVVSVARSCAEAILVRGTPEWQSSPHAHQEPRGTF